MSIALATFAPGSSTSQYRELLIMARSCMKRQPPGHTLQPTALVHEAWLKMGEPGAREWRSRGHFLATASRAMRQILVNHAIGRQTQKRAAQGARVELDEAVSRHEDRCGDLAALGHALDRLSKLHPAQAEIVELRFFGGLTMEQIAEITQRSLRTAEREWRAAKAWLRVAIEDYER